jgi:transcriptional regulator with XRE-family HTH domain
MRHTGDPELDDQLLRFAHNMREARQRAGLSQIGLGQKASLDRAAVSFLERAERAPDLPTILRVATAAGVSPGELLSGIGPVVSSDRVAQGQGQDGSAVVRFGANLRGARKLAGVSQESLAADAEVDRAAISVFERGRRAPNLPTVLKLARALKLPPGALLVGVQDDEAGS